MLAFIPSQRMALDLSPTALSIVVAVGGALRALMSHALFAGEAPATLIAPSLVLLGLAISGVHYVGVAAMTLSGFLMFDRGYVWPLWRSAWPPPSSPRRGQPT